jgi:hypothetical protein
VSASARSEDQKHKREHGEGDHPEPVEQPAEHPARGPRPRGCDQGMERVLLREGTQSQRQPRRQEQPADPVPGPPGSKDESHRRDGQAQHCLEHVEETPNSQTAGYQMPVHVRQPRRHRRQRHRCRRCIASNPPGCQDPHPHPPSTWISPRGMWAGKPAQRSCETSRSSPSLVRTADSVWPPPN